MTKSTRKNIGLLASLSVAGALLIAVLTFFLGYRPARSTTVSADEKGSVVMPLSSQIFVPSRTVSADGDIFSVMPLNFSGCQAGEFFITDIPFYLYGFVLVPVNSSFYSRSVSITCFLELNYDGSTWDSVSQFSLSYNSGGSYVPSGTFYYSGTPTVPCRIRISLPMEVQSGVSYNLYCKDAPSYSQGYADGIQSAYDGASDDHGIFSYAVVEAYPMRRDGIPFSSSNPVNVSFDYVVGAPGIVFTGYSSIYSWMTENNPTSLDLWTDTTVVVKFARPVSLQFLNLYGAGGLYSNYSNPIFLYGPGGSPWLAGDDTVGELSWQSSSTSGIMSTYYSSSYIAYDPVRAVSSFAFTIPGNIGGFMGSFQIYSDRSDLYDIGFSAGFSDGYDSGSSDGYSSGYYDGNGAGFESGYDKGHSEGYTEGYGTGYSNGLSIADKGDFFQLFAAVIDAPVHAFTSLLDFDLFGVNLSVIAGSLLTVALILSAYRLFSGGA